MPVQHQKEMLACVIFAGEPERIQDFFLYPPSNDTPSPGEIYVGKIDRMHKQTDGAFMRLQNKQMIYMPLRRRNRCDAYVMKTRREQGALLRSGDELLVQIDVTAQKTKLPRADGELNLPGRYLAVTSRDPGMHFSKKLSSEDKERILHYLQDNHCSADSFGLIIRTNAALADEAEMTAEYGRLKHLYEKLLQEGRTAETGSCLYRPQAPWAHLLDRLPLDGGTVIETDSENLLYQIRKLLSGRSEQPELRLYRDPSVPLYQLYGLGRGLERLQAKRVYLKSGGYLVIEQTEAFVAVDVNSGKYSGKLGREDAAYKINLEAAAEVLHQIRLRQLSGSVLVDFINMKQAEHVRGLMQMLTEAASEDPVKTTVVDMTPLGIVEITREKRYPPLAQQLLNAVDQSPA